MDFFLFILYTILGLFIIYRIWKYFKLKSFRKDIDDFHNNIITNTNIAPVWLKTGLRYHNKINVSFVKCVITHIYKEEKKACVVFKDPFKPFSKAISKTVKIKDIYPSWAIPAKYMNNK